MTSEQPVCDCGTFAVGRCQVCEVWVCGEHSEMFEDRRLCLEHHHEALAPQRAREAERRKEQEATRKRQEEEREERQRRQEAELEQQRSLRDRTDAAQALTLLAIPIVTFFYLDGQGMSRPLNMVLTGALAGFLAVAAKVAYSTYSNQGRTEEHFVWGAASFWIGLLGVPLGAVAGGILALVV